MHKITLHILKQLTLKPKLRYSQIKPSSVEGNHFTYYLNKLIKEGIVSKENDLYSLTSTGKHFVDKLSLENFQPRIQPKIVTLAACTNKNNEYLLYRRNRQPFFNLVGFPYGKIHLGETLQAAATRELKEKTGVNCKLIHRGDVYLTIHDGDELISQMLCHIFSGSNPTGELNADSKIGECFWDKFNPEENYFPGHKEILKLLTENKTRHFFAEFTFNLD